VKLAPAPLAIEAAGSPLSRRSLDKEFHGPLAAHSLGEMIAAGTATPGSAGYVALEHVTGTLDGHRGSFVLQHSATMDRGTPSLRITVVPDSGTDQLIGLRGTMTIEITDGKHFYDFEYTLDQR
jgi:hypothetical protein